MAIKLILREAVEHLGRRGDVVSVAPGYARNYLLPKRLAFAATPGNLKNVEHQRRAWATRETHELHEARALAERMGQVELRAVKKAGESGTLYGSVTKSEIQALLAAHGFKVDRRVIGPDDPIKSIGSFEVTVKLFPQVTARLKLHVEAQGEDAG